MHLVKCCSHYTLGISYRLQNDGSNCLIKMGKTTVFISIKTKLRCAYEKREIIVNNMGRSSIIHEIYVGSFIGNGCI